MGNILFYFTVRRYRNIMRTLHPSPIYTITVLLHLNITIMVADDTFNHRYIFFLGKLFFFEVTLLYLKKIMQKFLDIKHYNVDINENYLSHSSIFPLYSDFQDLLRSWYMIKHVREWRVIVDKSDVDDSCKCILRYARRFWFRKSWFRTNLPIS